MGDSTEEFADRPQCVERAHDRTSAGALNLHTNRVHGNVQVAVAEAEQYRTDTASAKVVANANVAAAPFDRLEADQAGPDSRRPRLFTPMTVG